MRNDLVVYFENLAIILRFYARSLGVAYHCITRRHIFRETVCGDETQRKSCHGWVFRSSLALHPVGWQCAVRTVAYSTLKKEKMSSGRSVTCVVYSTVVHVGARRERLQRQPSGKVEQGATSYGMKKNEKTKAGGRVSPLFVRRRAMDVYLYI